MMRKCWLPNPKDRPEFSKIEFTLKKIITELEQEMKQGQEASNIQTTYVNLNGCTECLYTNELMASPDESDLRVDGIMVLTDGSIRNLLFILSILEKQTDLNDKFRMKTIRSESRANKNFVIHQIFSHLKNILFSYQMLFRRQSISFS